MVYFIFVLLIVIYVALFTPYPFVWLLRRDKGSGRTESPENIETIKTFSSVEYGLKYPSRYKNNTYDLDTPKENNNHTFVVWLHGGAFVAGDSNGMRNYGPILASHGYTVVAMNYALAPENKFPRQIIQVDEILSELSAKYNIKRIVLGGDSAGANIAAMYIAFNKKLESELKVTLKFNRSIDQLILFCGPYDLTEDYTQDVFKEFKTFMKYIGWSYLGSRRWDKNQKKYHASPLLHVHKDFPSTYVTDGKKFSFMWQGIKLVEELKSLGVKVKSRFYEDKVHEFQFDFEENEKEAYEVLNDVINFLEERE